MAKKKTHEDFINEIKALYGDEYEILNKYNGSKSILKIKHNRCGNIFERAANHFKDGRTCTACRKHKTKKKTLSEYKKEVKKLVGDEYTVEGEYVSSFKKILMKHKHCGKTFFVTPNNFIQNHSRCPFCSKNRAKTTDEFKAQMHELVNDEYELISEYVNALTKVSILHKKCNRSYDVKPNVFLYGYMCPYCKKEEKAYFNRIEKTKKFKEDVKNLVGDEYLVIGEVINNATKLKMRHEKCNKEYYVSPGQFKAGSRCPYCSIKGKVGKKLTTEEFKDIVYDLVGDEYSVIGEYIKSRQKIAIKHNVCGKILEITPSSFRAGHRCKCKSLT